MCNFNFELIRQNKFSLEVNGFKLNELELLLFLNNIYRLNNS